MTARERRFVLDGLLSHASQFAARIAPAYKAMNWRWDPVGRVPYTDDIEREIRRQIVYMRDEAGEDTIAHSCGGITVRLRETDESDECDAGAFLEFGICEVFTVGEIPA